MDKKLEKLFDDYEGNLLNYFSGLTPEQSKEFNKKQKKWRKKWRIFTYWKINKIKTRES